MTYLRLSSDGYVAQPKTRQVPSDRNIIITETSHHRFVRICAIFSQVHNHKRLFYTDDDTGETLPASEDEDEVQSESHRRWDSRDVEWREFCLARLREEGWEAATFVPLLSERLGVETSSLEERLRRESAPRAAQDAVVQLCRRCVRYNCSLHPESSVLPALQPPPRAEAPEQPCGPRCYLNDAVETSTLWGEGGWDSDEIDLLEKVSVDGRFIRGEIV